MNTAFRVGRALAVPALAVVPALLALCLLTRYFGAELTAYCPAYDFDQFIYAREASTFAAAGFDGGFYGGDGHVARIGRYGPHGAAYAVVYGGLSRLLGGWRDWLAPAGNMLFMTLGLLVFARGLSLAAFAPLAALVALFPPLPLYVPTAYQEAPQAGLALVLALALSSLATSPVRPSGRRLWTACGLVLAATLTRPTWAVLFPAVFFCTGTSWPRAAGRGLVLGGAALALGGGLFFLTASPWVAVPGATGHMVGGLAAIMDNFRQNLGSLIHFADNRYHALTLFLMVAVLLLALAAPLADKAARLRLAVIHVCNLAGPLVIYLVLYNGSGRHLSRLLVAHAVLSLALCARTLAGPARTLVLAPALAGSLALLPATLAQYALFVRPAYDDYQAFGPRIEAQARAMDPALSLSLAAPSPWLRTLAIVVPDLALPFLAAPPAYGIELYVRQGLETPLRAGFALLDAEAYAAVSRHTPLTMVAETPAGILYRNDAAFGFAPYPSGKGKP